MGRNLKDIFKINDRQNVDETISAFGYYFRVEDKDVLVDVKGNIIQFKLKEKQYVENGSLVQFSYVITNSSAVPQKAVISKINYVDRDITEKQLNTILQAMKSLSEDPHSEIIFDEDVYTI